MNISSEFKDYKRKNPAIWSDQRNDLLKQIINNKVPEWGSINIKVTKNGI